MGLLTNAGYPIAWDTEENAAAVKYVLQHGIDQFLALYTDYKQEVNRPFLWGDELEYSLVEFDEESKTAKLWLKAGEPLEQLNKGEEEAKGDADKLSKLEGLWRPEYGSFMIEGTPAQPYNYSLVSIASCEESLSRRRRMLKAVLPKNVIPCTLVNFPRMGSIDPKSGTSDFTSPTCLPRGTVSHSLFVPDNCINPHPRFGTLTANIRKRRGKKVSIRIPLYMDEKTAVDPFLNVDANAQNKHLQQAPAFGDDDDDDDDDDEPPLKKVKLTTPVDHSNKDDLKPNVTPTMYYFAQYFNKEESKDIVKGKHAATGAALPSIYMDCMAFGMGCNCLQTTFQARHIDQARHVYDQLAVLSPIMLAMSAATPIHKGLLSEIDVRWMVISESVDDRKDTEVPDIMKSRYDSISTYISTRPSDPYFAAMNDVKLAMDKDVYRRLREAEIDHRLARHVSHLFIRDPLVMYSGKLHQLEDARHSDHFENIQSTNWQSMRFKPPPPKSADANIGWRVEFRMMDAQMSSFENAAYDTFSILLARAIIEFDLDFYIPLTKSDVNSARAHVRDAVGRKQFIMQKHITKLDILKDPESVQYCEMNCDEIFNGNDHFEGLISIVNRYIAVAKKTEFDGQPKEVQEKWLQAEKRINAYLELLKGRANGSIQTTAKYIRNFVVSHPTYKKDSRVSQEICYDLCKLSDRIAGGDIPEELVPKRIIDMAGGVA